MKKLAAIVLFCASAFGASLTDIVTVNTGTVANDRTGDTLRLATMKTLTNINILSNVVSSLSDAVSTIGGASPTNKLTITSNLLDVASATLSRSNIHTFPHITISDYVPDPSGATESTTALVNTLSAASDGDDVYLPEGTFVIDTVTVSKAIRLHLSPGTRLKHKGAATSSMLNWTASKGEITGGVLDGNMANQSTATWRSLLMLNSSGAFDFKVNGVTFTNFVKNGIESSSTSYGNIRVEDSKFLNGREHGGTIGFFSSGISLLSSVANTTSTVQIAHCDFIQDSLPSDFGTTASSAPGGILITGGGALGGTNNAANIWYNFSLEHSYFSRVGQNKAGNHIAAVQMYSGCSSVSIVNNRFEDCLFHVVNIGNSGRSIIKDNILTSRLGDDLQDAVAIQINPNVRQDSARVHRYANVSDNIIDGYLGHAGIYFISSNYATNRAFGFEAIIANNIITNCSAGLGVYAWEGPINVSGNHIWTPNTGGYAFLNSAVVMDEIDGNVNLFGNFVSAHGSTGVYLAGTNANYQVFGNYFSDDGEGSTWEAFTARGVKSLNVSHSWFNGYNSAQAARVLQGSDGTHTGTLSWDYDSNLIVAGTFNIISAQVDAQTGVTTGNGFPWAAATTQGKWNYDAHGLEIGGATATYALPINVLRTTNTEVYIKLNNTGTNSLAGFLLSAGPSGHTASGYMYAGDDTYSDTRQRQAFGGKLNGDALHYNFIAPLSSQDFNFYQGGFTSSLRLFGTTNAALAGDVTAYSVTADTLYGTNLVVGYNVKATNALQFQGTSQIKSGTDGCLTLLDSAGTSFTRLQLGGTSSSFPMWKRNSAVLEAKLADDSAYATLNAGVVALGSGFASMNASSGAGFNLGSGKQFAFSSTTAEGGSKDTGIARDAAGIIRVTDGSTGTGSVRASAGQFDTAKVTNGIDVGNTDTSITRSAAGIIAVENKDVVDVSSTQTLTGKTFDSQGTGNVLKFLDEVHLVTPHQVDNTGATRVTTEGATYGHATFSNSADKAGNYVIYRFRVPFDLDTGTDLSANFTFRLGGADTGKHAYEISMADVADSAGADSPTFSNAVAMNFAGDASGASADVESTGYTTLTSWRSSLTAGHILVIKLSRDGDDGTNDTSTVNSTDVELSIKYGRTQ